MLDQFLKLNNKVSTNEPKKQKQIHVQHENLSERQVTSHIFLVHASSLFNWREAMSSSPLAFIAERLLFSLEGFNFFTKWYFSTSLLAVKAAFVLFLGTQLFLEGRYQWPEDYLTRALPLYKPYPSYSISSVKFQTDVPDNACMRTKFFDPKNPSVSSNKKLVWLTAEKLKYLWIQEWNTTTSLLALVLAEVLWQIDWAKMQAKQFC